MQRGKHKGNNRKGKQDVPQGLPSEPARLAKDCFKTAVTACDDQRALGKPTKQRATAKLTFYPTTIETEKVALMPIRKCLFSTGTGHLRGFSPLSLWEPCIAVPQLQESREVFC